MNSLLSIVKQLHPNLSGLKETTIADKNNSIVGYNSTFYDTALSPLGGGLTDSFEEARRIAVAETIERGLYRKIRLDPKYRNLLRLDCIDSTLGFACGFEKEPTAYRSFCEALEKWCLSQIIDFNYKIDRVDKHNNNLSKLANFLVSDFNQFNFFQKKFHVKAPFEKSDLELTFNFFVGFTETGIFPGSQVTSVNDNAFTHPVVEAWRHLKNYQLLKKRNPNTTNLIEKRLLYFGDQKTTGLAQILSSKNTNWKKPELELFEEIDTNFQGVYLYRTLLKDFIPVSKGDVGRFVI